MKKLILLPTFVFLLFQLEGAILTVSNSSETIAQYSNLTTAITAASSGDTIMVHPSGTPQGNGFGDISLNKTLHIIGVGKDNPLYQGHSTKLRNISFSNSSSGSSIEGFYIVGYISIGQNQTANSVLIRNCYFENTNILINSNGASSSNWIFEGCIIHAKKSGTLVAGNSGVKSITFRSNIFHQDTTYSGSFFTDLIFSPVWEANIFILNSATTFLKNVKGGSFQNNIMIQNHNNSMNFELNCSPCQFDNNLTFSPQGTLPLLTSGSNNLDNTDPQFTLLIDAYRTFNVGNDYHVNNASALTGGSNSSSIGVHNNGFNFRMESISNYYPRISSFNLLKINVPLGDSLKITTTGVGAGK